MKVYVADVEVRPLPGSELEDGAGAEVDVFIPAVILEDALRQLLHVLVEDRYAMVAINDVRECEQLEWPNEEASKGASELKAEALKSGAPVYGVFYVWTDDYIQ